MDIPISREAPVEPNVQQAPQMPMGSPVGRAMEHAGNVVEGAGAQGMEYAREQQAKADASVVMDSYVDFSKNVLDLDAQARQKKGKDAQDFNDTLEAYDKAYSDTMGKLSTDRQRFIFKEKSAPERIRLETNLHRHAAEQAEILNHANAKALVDIEEQKLSLSYRDDGQFDTNKSGSQINQYRAAVIDQLDMQGVPLYSDTWNHEYNAAMSRAYVDRVKLLMSESPSKALSFLKDHEQEIEPKALESLQKEVRHQSEEQEGIDAAFNSFAGRGEKTEIELTTELHKQFKDKPGAFKIAQAQVNHLYTQQKADDMNAVVAPAGKIEAMIDEAWARGRVVSQKDITKSPEYQELSKLVASGSKPAAVEMAKVRAYVAKGNRELKRESHKAARETREANNEWMAMMLDSDRLTHMTDTEIKEEARSRGLKFSQIKQLETARQKYLKNPEEQYYARWQNDAIKGVLNKVGVPTDEQSQLTGDVGNFIQSEEKRLGRKLTTDEAQSAVVKRLQDVWHKEKGLFGLGAEKWVKANPGEAKPTTFPKDFTDRVSAVEKKRGVKVSDAQRQSLYEEYKKEKE